MGKQSDNGSCHCTTRQRRNDAASCPECGKKGLPVSPDTVRHHIKDPLFTRLNVKNFRFCRTPACSIVYYPPEGCLPIRKQDIRVRVGLKETEDPAWVCYCFDISKRMIKEEIGRTGRSTVSERIRKEVYAGNCECEIKNPSGRCCLGEVRRLEKDLQERSSNK